MPTPISFDLAIVVTGVVYRSLRDRVQGNEDTLGARDSRLNASSTSPSGP